MMPVVTPQSRALGWWTANGTPAATDVDALRAALANLHQAVTLVESDGKLALGEGGVFRFGEVHATGSELPVSGYAPASPVEHLGERSFCEDHGLRFACVAGAMANGIGSEEIVEAMGREGMLGFFGAGGLPLARVEQAVDRVTRALGSRPFGFNLIHSPNEPELEAAVVELYLRRGVRLIEASAFLGLTLPVIRYRVHGIRRDADGRVVTPNRIVAKVSRVEVASQFFSPPPPALLQELLRRGDLTAEQAKLAGEIPVAQDVTAEADSGGHTDNRPAISLLPTMIALRDRMQAQFGFAQALRVGAAGGMATPSSVAAAFAMGAAYVVTGSVNQACVESGSSDPVRQMLAQAQQADVAMAPAGDMFEMGVKVQVLKRGTMFPMRAAKLYELYRAHDRLEAIPAADRANLEKNFFRATFEETWEQTKRFFQQRDPRQIERAEREPKHQMALVFRSYLGQSSRWANAGEPTRAMDYQIWCGPAMGAFNEWARGSFLEAPANRRVVTIAWNLLHGAGVTLRLATLRGQGLRLPPELTRIRPVEPDALRELLRA